MTTDAVKELIESSQGLVRSVAIKIHGKVPKYILLDDLIGYGQVGLAQAAQAYSTERGVSFSTFAYYRIRGEIYDGLAKMNWSSRSAAVRIRREQREAEVLEQDARQTQSTSSSTLVAEADWLATTTRRLAAVYLTSQTAAEEELSLDAADRQPAPADAAADAEILTVVRDLVSNLPEPAGTLMRLAYYEGLSLTEIGERLGKSKSWASRLHSRTLDRLSQALGQMGAC